MYNYRLFNDSPGPQVRLPVPGGLCGVDGRSSSLHGQTRWSFIRTIELPLIRDKGLRPKYLIWVYIICNDKNINHIFRNASENVGTIYIFYSFHIIYNVLFVGICFYTLSL